MVMTQSQIFFKTEDVTSPSNDCLIATDRKLCRFKKASRAYFFENRLNRLIINARTPRHI